MELNNEQIDARNTIDAFLKSNNKFFTLTGPAGTGKTTVISTIFKNFKYNSKKIVLSATTNKAVSVIEQMFSNKYEDENFFS